MSLDISKSPSFFTKPIKNREQTDFKDVKFCSDGHRVGSEKIHKALHTLLTSIPNLQELDINKYNPILLAYWTFNDDFVVEQNAVNWPFNTVNITPSESINREVRNIFESGRPGQRGNIMEKEVRATYAARHRTS